MKINKAGLTVDGVSVIYANGHVGLDQASFSLPTSSITALVGINGSGKSTLFKAIMGFVPIKQGRIRIFSQSSSYALKEKQVVYVPQTEDVDWNFPILVRNVVMMARFGHMSFMRRPKPADHSFVNEALKRVGLWDERHRQIGELSGGQKKRVFLARALAQQGEIILLDEPFTGVDVKTEEQIIKIMTQLRSEGKILLVSTHNLGSVPEFCDHTLFINRTILAFGKTEEVFTQENLKQAFGGVLRSFVLAGKDLHKDNDIRKVTVLTDDERPFVIYGDE